MPSLLGFGAGVSTRSAAPRRRRKPAQARSRATVEYVLQAAARVYRREGSRATTNHIAREAGIGIGSLYEYFEDKLALLEALAQRHVELAERGVAEVLERAGSTRELLAGLQQAILASQQFPSHALALIEHETPLGAALRERASRVRERMLEALAANATRRGLSDPQLRARAAFGALAELTSLTSFELQDDPAHARLASMLLEMAVHVLAAD